MERDLQRLQLPLLTTHQIADKLTVLWIGGREYADLAIPPPNYSNPEYNVNIDIAAARVIFNRSTIPISQVPRNAYRAGFTSLFTTAFKSKAPGK
jgi:hypothetical protein